MYHYLNIVRIGKSFLMKPIIQPLFATFFYYNKYMYNKNIYTFVIYVLWEGGYAFYFRYIYIQYKKAAH